MAAWICATCGVQHAESDRPPARCAICEDERQYVPREGQRWTTLDELRRERRAELREEGPRLLGVGCEPEFAIGQRALLLQTHAGNVLWDCVPMLDEMVERVRSVGGLRAIALDHPHFYSTMVDWSRAFDVPIYLHAADRRWVMRPDDAIVFWDGETHELLPRVTLIQCGGHFEGGTVLHWNDDGGALLSGDIVTVVADPGWVSFMYSYPNLIPLDAQTVERIVERLEPFEFDRIHGGWWGRVVETGGKEAIRRSAARYIRGIGGAARAAS